MSKTVIPAEMKEAIQEVAAMEEMIMAKMGTATVIMEKMTSGMRGIRQAPRRLRRKKSRRKKKSNGSGKKRNSRPGKNRRDWPRRRQNGWPRKRRRSGLPKLPPLPPLPPTSAGQMILMPTVMMAGVLPQRLARKRRRKARYVLHRRCDIGDKSPNLSTGRRP